MGGEEIERETESRKPFKLSRKLGRALKRRSAVSTLAPQRKVDPISQSSHTPAAPFSSMGVAFEADCTHCKLRPSSLVSSQLSPALPSTLMYPLRPSVVARTVKCHIRNLETCVCHMYQGLVSVQCTSTPRQTTTFASCWGAADGWQLNKTGSVYYVPRLAAGSSFLFSTTASTAAHAAASHVLATQTTANRDDEDNESCQHLSGPLVAIIGVLLCTCGIGVRSSCRQYRAKRFGTQQHRCISGTGC
jgi:hypothetical protein